jgi:phosphoglycolate phosphatase-like HAD superfamily hydrolase
MNQLSPSFFQAFIFDLDGTLVDSNELHVNCWDAAFRHFGKHFSREALRSQIRKGSDHYLPEFLSPEEIERFGKQLDKYRSELFQTSYLPHVRPFPKVHELFQFLHDDGKQIILATSGKESEANHYIKLLDISDLIEACITADDARQSKPAPDLVVVARNKVKNVLRSQIVMVGDTRFDVEAANRAGLPAVAFLCGGTDQSVLKGAGAAAIYRSPADFLSASLRD